MTTGRETSPRRCRERVRLHDNAAFNVSHMTTTSRGDHYVLRPVYVLDPLFRKHVRAGANRRRFLQRSLADLDASLWKLDARLWGVPEDVFPDLFLKWNVKQLTLDVGTEPYARDERVERLAEWHGVMVVGAVLHIIYYSTTNLMTMTTYVKLRSNTTLLPSMNSYYCHPICIPYLASKNLILTYDIGTSTYTTPDLITLLWTTGVNAINMNNCKCSNLDGDTILVIGLTFFNDLTDNEAWVRGFEKPKTFPNSLLLSTIVLSPYLKFGCLSASLFYRRLREVRAGCGVSHMEPP